MVFSPPDMISTILWILVAENKNMRSCTCVYYSCNIAAEVKETKLAPLVFAGIVAFAIVSGITVPYAFGSVPFGTRTDFKDVNLDISSRCLLLLRPLGDPISDPTPNHK